MSVKIKRIVGTSFWLEGGEWAVRATVIHGNARFWIKDSASNKEYQINLPLAGCRDLKELLEAVIEKWDAEGGGKSRVDDYA